MPAVSVCTSAFTAPARSMAKVYGFPGYEFVTVPHPIASLNEEQMRVRAAEVLPDVRRILGVET